MQRPETTRTRAAHWQISRTWGGTTGDSRADPGPSSGGVCQHLDHLQQSPHQHRGRRRHRLDMGPAEKRRYPGGSKSPMGTRKKTSSFYFCIFCTELIVWQFQGGNVANATFSLLKLPNCELLFICALARPGVPGLGQALEGYRDLLSPTQATQHQARLPHTAYLYIFFFGLLLVLWELSSLISLFILYLTFYNSSFVVNRYFLVWTNKRGSVAAVDQS